MPNPDRSHRIMEIFEAIYDLDPAEQERMLKEKAGNDQDVRAEVMALLEGQRRADAFNYLEKDDATRTKLPSLVGSTIGSFRLESMLASGGMGQVYRARHIHLNRPVALKIPHIDHPHREQFSERLRREGRALALLDHPHIVKVYDAGVTDDDVPFIAMAFVEGESLSAVKSLGPLDEALVVKWGSQLADALDYLHLQGIFHRDIKTSNILIDGNGNAVLADFGIAHIEDFARMTTQLPGTPAYMCPEQLQGRPIDGRCDLYSLGLVLFECAAGEQPDGRPLKTMAPHLSDRVADAIEKCIQRNPAFRHQRGAALKLALSVSPDFTSSSVKKTVTHRWLIGAAISLGVVAAALLIRPDEPAVLPTETMRSEPLPPSLIESLEAASLNLDEFQRLLQTEMASGNLSFGNEQDFLSPGECYVFVFDQQGTRAVAILEPGLDRRVDRLTGDEIFDLDDFLQNRRTLWVLLSR